MITDKKRTVAYFIEHLSKQHKDKTAIIFRKEYRTYNYTYQEIYDLAHRIAGFFEDKKIKKGDRIIIYSYNSPEWGGLLLACALSGVVAVPLDINSSKEFVMNTFREADAKYIFCSRKKRVFHKEIIIEDLMRHSKEFHKYRCKANIKKDDLLEIVYTSGTTSDPKGVMISNENLVSNIMSLVEVIGMKSNHTFLSVLPLSHMFEQTVGFFTPMALGNKIVYLRSRKSSEILEAISEHNVTSMVVVPAVLELFKEKIENRLPDINRYLGFANYLPVLVRRLVFFPVIRNFKRLRWLICGGAPLNKVTEIFWDRLGIEVIQGYGLTEASPVVTCNTLREHRPGTVGRVLENQEIKLVNGEVLARGRNITKGYFKNAKKTRESIVQGWFFTGDVGEIEDEYLKIVGRIKNVIVTSAGLNVYPEDIEKIIKVQPDIKDCCVVGIEQEKKTLITAVVLTKKPIDRKKFLERVNDKLEPYQKLHDVIAWHSSDFPRTATLKILRKKVKEELSSDKVKKEPLTKILEDVSKKKIKESSKLYSDLKLDSLHRLELVSLIEERLHVEIDESRIDADTTVAGLKQMIEEKQKLEKLRFMKLPITLYFRIIRTILQSLLSLSLSLFVEVEVKGGIRQGPVIIAANHESHLDTPLIIRTLPFSMRLNTAVAAARDYFFDEQESPIRGFRHKIFRWFAVLAYNAYPFERQGSIRESLRYTGKLIDKGFSILIFPEGTRSVDGKLGIFKPGVGFVAKEMDIPVVPVKIEGAGEAMPKGSIFPKKGKIKITIGKPITFEEESYIEAAKILKKNIEGL